MSGRRFRVRFTPDQQVYAEQVSGISVGWPVWLLPQRPQTAKAASAHCPITRQCLRWAVFQEVEDEIWGRPNPPANDDASAWPSCPHRPEPEAVRWTADAF